MNNKPKMAFSIQNFSYFQMWREVWRYASPKNKRTILFYHSLFIIAVSVESVQPYLLGQLVNTLQKGGNNLFHESAYYLLAIIASLMVFWALHGPARVVERITGQQIYIRFIDTVYRQVTEMPLRWHNDNHSGSTINRIMLSATGLRTFVETSFVSISNLWRLMSAIAMLVFFNPMLGGASLLCFVIGLLIIITMNKPMVRAMHQNNEVSHQASATFYDFVSNSVSIIILRLQKFSQISLHKKLEASVPTYRTQIVINEWRYFVYTLFNAVVMTLILLGYIYFQLKTATTIAAGTLVTVYLYQDRIGSQGFAFISMHADWLKSLTGLSAVNSLLEQHRLQARAAPPAPPTTWKEVELQNISFTHHSTDGEHNTVLHDISLTLRHGEKIALIGSSGGGKTTLLSLLRALHTPTQGAMKIDGSTFPFTSLADLTTLIPQDPEIFENSIRFNVSFGLDVPDEIVLEALGQAEFLPVLEQMPHGLDTDIREKGVNLSVGQKQRLALARGLFAAQTSDIILMDEPTSSIDLITEERIFQNIFHAFRGKTLIATLHRLHLLPQFDRIIYLDKGRVALDLPAEEALSKPGPVQEMYRRYQSKAG